MYVGGEDCSTPSFTASPWAERSVEVLPMSKANTLSAVLKLTGSDHSICVRGLYHYIFQALWICSAACGSILPSASSCAHGSTAETSVGGEEKILSSKVVTNTLLSGGKELEELFFSTAFSISLESEC